jgi:hypothetical protein
MNRQFLPQISAAGLFLALVGSACTAQAQSPTPPAPPAAPLPPVTAGSSSSAAAWSMSTTENGRTVKVEGKNGAITAEVDGKPVPADRLVRKGSSIIIKDEKGETIFESEAPDMDTSSRTYIFNHRGPGDISVSPHSRSRGGLTFNDPNDRAVRIQMDPPTVMIGVQLLEPDSSLRGHLGLKEDETTMVSAVYEGLAAAQAGLEPYDIIVGVNGKTPAPPVAVRKALRDAEAGKPVSLDIVHRGQKKTISVTPEKYDPEKLEKAKVNAIAAASNIPGGSGAMDPDQGWWGQGGAVPKAFVGTFPGQPGKSITLWRNWAGGGDEDMAKHIQELTKRAREQAEQAQAQAELLREQIQHLHGGVGAPGMIDMNKLMEDRMKKMEEMLQKIMEGQKNTAPAPKKDEGRS